MQPAHEAEHEPQVRLAVGEVARGVLGIVETGCDVRNVVAQGGHALAR